MKIVTIANPMDASKTISLVARYENMRSGFRHVAETDDGVKAKCRYLNRTWEVYTYQTVLHRLAECWIRTKTGWNPNTKRDGAKFEEMYGRMVAEIDRNHGWM